MSRGQERRLSRLENDYAAKLETQRVVELRWLTLDEIQRGAQACLCDPDSQSNHHIPEIFDRGRRILYAEESLTASGEPFLWQSSFHQSTARYKGFSGPVGSGKSRALCYEALRLAYENPGCTGLIGAPTYPMLRDATLLAFREMLDDNEVPYNFQKSENVLL